MLTVVKHDERSPTVQEVDDSRQIALRIAAERKTERGCDRGHDAVAVSDVGEFDEPHLDEVGIA